MSQSDPAFLAKLEEQSKERQQRFMQNISDRLGHAPLTEPPTHPHRGAPTFWKEHNLNKEDCITQFSDNWRAAGGHLERFATMAEAKAYMIQTAEELAAQRWIRHDHPQLHELALESSLPEAEVTVWDSTAMDEMKEYAAEADIGVIVAEHAVSITGSIVSISSSGRGRSVSLLPTVLMALVPSSVIKAKLGEVMAEIEQVEFGQMPAGIHFISGPSRSADIENDLTIGVHGPGVVFALIVDEL